MGLRKVHICIYSSTFIIMIIIVAAIITISIIIIFVMVQLQVLHYIALRTVITIIAISVFLSL